MQGNDFEKEVRERMDELQLYPSASVWPEVEQRIRNEKKKRRLIFWWLLPLLLAGGILLYFSREKNNKGGNTASNTVAVPAGNQQPVANTDNNITNNTNDNTGPSSATHTNNINRPENKTIPGAGSGVTVQQVVTPASKHKTATVPGQQLAGEHKERILITSSAPGKKGRREKPSVENKIAVTAAVPAIAAQSVPATTSQNKITADEVPVDAVSAAAIPPVADENKKPADTLSAKKRQPVSVTPAVSADAASSAAANEKKEKEMKKKHQWETGITFGGGYSERIKGDLSLGSMKAADLQSSAAGSPGTFLRQPKGEMTGGLYLYTGLYARKPLGSKTYIKTGLSWDMYTIDQRTGVLASSQSYAGGAGVTPGGNSTFYYSGNSSQYRSQYHQFSIPVHIGWQLNKGKKMPVEWENGFSAGYIPFARNLVFNSSSNIYYRDDKQLHRWQYLYSSILNVRIFPAAHHPVTIGAGITYHLSPLQKASAESRNRLFTYGIRVGWTFKK